jgi:hypothetical protein
MSPFAVTFNQTGTFAATYEAERLLKAHGFAIGPSQRGSPRAVMFGNYVVAKWSNLDHNERRETHATLTGDGREGPLRRIAYLRPSGPSRNTLVEHMERIALDALAKVEA